MLILRTSANYTTRSSGYNISVVASSAAIVILLVLPMTARALSCAPKVHTLLEAYEAAESIIVGLVTECEEEINREPWANGGSGCSFGGKSVSTQISYQVGGDVPEQILSAMSEPSDIVVAAVLMSSPNVDSGLSTETSQIDRGATIQAPQDDAYFSQAPLESGSTKPQIARSAGDARTYQSRKEPPESILLLQTRSTQLSAMLEDCQTCYKRVER